MHHFRNCPVHPVNDHDALKEGEELMMVCIWRLGTLDCFSAFSPAFSPLLFTLCDRSSEIRFWSLHYLMYDRSHDIQSYHYHNGQGEKAEL